MWEDDYFFQLYGIWVVIFLVLAIGANYKKTISDAYLWGWLILGVIGKSLRYLYFKLGDVQVYRLHYEQMVNRESLKWSSADLLYTYYTQFTSLFKSTWLHFLGIELLILVPILVWCKKISKQYAWWALAIFLAYPHFVAYSVNGLRFGIASSFFLLATSFPKKDWKGYFLMLIAVLFHFTLLLPVLIWCFILLFHQLKIKHTLIIFLVTSIFGILFPQSILELITQSIPIEHSYRLHFYLEERLGNGITQYGQFRWKFWILNVLFIAGIVVINQLKWKNDYWLLIAKLFIITSGVTTLFYGAYFSNRFASLVWILIPPLVILPILKGISFHYKKYLIGGLSLLMIMIQVIKII